MDCTTVQHLLQDFDDGQLSDAVGRDLRRHLGECSDCRVTRQRALHLQQLLAVKRHESPGAQYFENFLGEFHQRLAIATAPRPTLWQSLCARLHIQPAPTLRYGFVHALGVACAVALIWRGISGTELPVSSASHADLDFATPHLVASTLPAPQSTPQMIASALPARSPQSTSAGGALILPAAANFGLTGPRYVLDHITVTPASYEVASINF